VYQVGINKGIVPVSIATFISTSSPPTGFTNQSTKWRLHFHEIWHRELLNIDPHVGFEVFIVVMINMQVFWDVKPCW